MYGRDVAAGSPSERPAAGRHTLRHGVPRGLAEETGGRRHRQTTRAQRQGQERTRYRGRGHRVRF